MYVFKVIPKNANMEDSEYSLSINSAMLSLTRENGIYSGNSTHGHEYSNAQVNYFHAEDNVMAMLHHKEMLVAAQKIKAMMPVIEFLEMCHEEEFDIVLELSTDTLNQSKKSKEDSTLPYWFEAEVAHMKNNMDLRMGKKHIEFLLKEVKTLKAMVAKLEAEK